MRNCQESKDLAVIRKLNEVSKSEPSYWSYSTRSRSDEAFDFFQYPAMMVPEMLRDLIQIVTDVDPSIQTIYDPFAGSGSVLTEAMLRGTAFVGQDINPLAVLLCKVRSGPFRLNALNESAEDLLDAIEGDSDPTTEADFPNIEKWFNKVAIRELSAIRRAIRCEPNIEFRRFFWVSLAETVRLSSNSRTSTYKMHIRDAANLRQRRSLSPKEIFDNTLSENLMKHSQLAYFLDASGLLKRGIYTKPISTQVADVRVDGPSITCDMLITSPPYGDNQTTVPYGQHSYLPLQWIDLHDIDRRIDTRCLSNAYWIDSHSLGGNRKKASAEVESLTAESPSLRNVLSGLRQLPRDRRNRVAAFSRDLHACINPILRCLRKHAYMVWVVGNRQVGGLEVPTSGILREFLEAQGAVHVDTIERKIPSKRMATKNSISETMRKEKILILRKA